MKRGKAIKEEIKLWENDFSYIVEDFNFSSDEWLIIDIKALSIVIADTRELIRDIRMIYPNANLYSIDLFPNGEGVSLWISLK